MEDPHPNFFYFPDDMPLLFRHDQPNSKVPYLADNLGGGSNIMIPVQGTLTFEIETNPKPKRRKEQRGMRETRTGSHGAPGSSKSPVSEAKITCNLRHIMFIL